MNIEQPYKTKKGSNGKVVAGLILLLLGAGLLLQQITWFNFPNWIYSGYTVIIIVGLYLGARNNFKPSIWVLFLIFGGLNMLDNIFPGANFDDLVFPLIVISIGIWLIIRRNQTWGKKQAYFNTVDTENQVPPVDQINPAKPAGTTENPANPNPANSFTPPFQGVPYGDSYLDSVSVFSGTKKTILSKDFKGGEIVNIFGGTEINLAMADINGRVEIEVVQIFGGIKMIVPPHWQVVSDVASVFAGVDDKRHIGGAPQSTDKILVIKGTSIFAGIDIRSF